jgi:thioredoxin 1
MTKEINDSNFDGIISTATKPILVDFWAPWCGPCKQIAPILDQISQEISEIEIYKCNVDDNPESPSKFGVRGIPALMIFKNGKLADSKVGSLPKTALAEWIKSNI